MRHLPGFRLVLCAALLATVAGCGPDSDQNSSPTAPVRLYGSDGNMLNGVGALVKNQPRLLDGMKGTAPLIRLTEDFRRRLNNIDPNLHDLAYAGESYDAVVIAALATQLARTTDPEVVKNYIVGVTNFGQPCTAVAECLNLAREGKDLQYVGVTVKTGLSEIGEPSTTTYGTMHFDTNNKINDVLTEYVGAGAPGTASAQPGPAPAKPSTKPTGAPLIIGDLTSHSGGNSESNPPIYAGARLAIKEINDAEGVLEKPVQWLNGDDKTDIEKAKAQLKAHISAGAQIVLGPTTSRVTAGVMEQITSSKVIAISPSATSAQLSTVVDDGRFFRTAPSDVLQGKALADVILRDGTKRISIIAMKGAYGEGLQINVRDELIKAGVPSSAIQTLNYDAPSDDAVAINVSEQVKSIKGFAPDGVLVIGLDESAQVLTQLATAGVDPRKTPAPKAD
ncbi:ABC-type branched-subunit amino acid transport system substrate-binding protein [Allocatelliglobosispora scoriae]|uniref:ABC-type branched-subunit amino acid transport system substrate-binding protein n=1 Tax=Allocatelliglobosispora scoriae TaxID=643052 RepID=A0A841BRG9_9ACTN|nr:ABC transporter substrate-binding protein [Allocatelliglobosispora scoriae]MBB5870834.1 ABC-type branched-subunit amino acid transport system substrate-binding protein [Allocatelliglobosispora scoriae]